MYHRHRVGLLSAVVLVLAGGAAAAEPKVTKFARFEPQGGRPAYGLVKGDRVTQIEGTPYGQWKETDKSFALAEVKLLVPARPTQVLALAGNYRSHLPDEKITEKFQIPQIFFKSPSCLVPHGADIVIPKGATNVHYEAELVVVIGKRAKAVPEAKALEYVLGVTCGNDVSARDWQRNDVQWWRAKGSDTFGPCGPYLVSGLNYDDLRLQLRLNGKVLQDQRTKDLIHNVSKTVSFISDHVTLHPGDLIYTGTPAKTSAMNPGDLVEVEIEGVGVLANRVRAEK